MAALDLQNILMEFQGKPVLQDLNIQIPRGEFLVVLGESGGGKSTLLNLIAGLLEPTAGRILFDGQDVTRQSVMQRNIAYVFQDYALYPHMTVARNICFPMENLKWPRQEIDQKCREILQRLKLEEVRDQYPSQISGGQKQRVAIGRALVRDPQLFLFDEPLSSLDPHLRDHLRLELKQLHRELDKTFIYVTHDQLSAMVLGDRIAFLDHGVIQQVGAPMELYRSPANIRIARFLGFPPINLLSPEDFKMLTGKPSPQPQGRIGLRPEHLEWVEDAEGKFEIQWIQPVGATGYAYVAVGEQNVCGLWNGGSRLEKGKVSCQFNPENLLFFKEE
jgi:ABC-type sugar transport system ATPase subunit